LIKTAAISPKNTGDNKNPSLQNSNRFIWGQNFCDTHLFLPNTSGKTIAVKSPLLLGVELFPPKRPAKVPEKSLGVSVC